MSKKSKSSKPAAPRVKEKHLRQARPIAEKYQVVVWSEGGEYFGRGVEMPFAFGDGKTVEACVRNTRAAFVAGVASTLQDGDVPPAPAAEEKREMQVNVRITATERLILEAAARRKGFTGLSDYFRAAALAGAK